MNVHTTDPATTPTAVPTAATTTSTNTPTTASSSSISLPPPPSPSTASPWRIFKRKASQELDAKNSSATATATDCDTIYPPTPPKSVASSIRRSSTDSNGTRRSANSWQRKFEDVLDGFEEHTEHSLSNRSSQSGRRTSGTDSSFSSNPSLAAAASASTTSVKTSQSRTRASPIHPSYFQPASMRPTAFIPTWFNKDFPHKDYTGPKPPPPPPLAPSSARTVTGNDLNPTPTLPNKLEDAHSQIVHLHQQLMTTQQELGRHKGQLNKANEEHCRIVEQVKQDVRAEVEQACREEYEDKVNQIYRQFENGQKNYRDSYQTLLDNYNRLSLENNHLRQVATGLTPDPESIASPRSDTTGVSSMTLRAASPLHLPTIPPLESVKNQFRDLQLSISSLMEQLLTHIDPKKATALFERAYPTLNLAAHLSDPSASLSDFVILMLTEKLIMDTLMRDVFCVPLQPGVAIQPQYAAMRTWMEHLDREWSAQFRQRVCSLVNEDPRTQRDVDAQVQIVTSALLEVLQLGFPSFFFSEQLQSIVARAVRLSLAMQAQDEIVYPIHVQEGSDLFDPKRMMSVVRGEKGLLARDVPGTGLGSIVMFCICPPFIGGRKEDVVFAKGKVYCE